MKVAVGLKTRQNREFLFPSRKQSCHPCQKESRTQRSRRKLSYLSQTLPDTFTLRTFQPPNEQKEIDGEWKARWEGEVAKVSRSRGDDAFYSPSFVSPNAILNPLRITPKPTPSAACHAAHSRIMRFVPSKVLISMPPHHLRNLSRYSSLSSLIRLLLARSRSLETRHSRKRAVCQPSFIDSTVEPCVANYRERKGNEISEAGGGL